MYYDARLCFLPDNTILIFFVSQLKKGGTIKWISIRPLDKFCYKKTKSIDGSGFCPNVPVTSVETLYSVFPAEL